MKPILFTLFGIPIHSYGALVALGVLVSIFFMRRRHVKSGFENLDFALDLVFVTLASGFLGGRLYYVLQNWDWYLAHPLKIFHIWEGGLIFYGGVFGSLIGLYAFTRYKKHSFLKALDFLIPYVALTHAFGRVGCFLNGCCYGKFCNYAWCFQFSSLMGATHPTQLYEAIFVLGLSVFLSYRCERPHREGAIIGQYFLIYGIGRFFLEFFRSDNPFFLFLTWNQWISLILIGILPGFMIYNHRRSPDKKSLHSF